MIVGKTPVSAKAGEKMYIIVQDRNNPNLINTTKYFEYLENPVVIDIYPLSHLLRCAELQLHVYDSVKERSQVKQNMQ